MDTYHVKKEDRLQKKWYVINAEGNILGRLSVKAATLLRGKHKPIFSPHIDVGDYVIIVNADKIVLKGSKREKKIYYRHTGYIGGLKSIKAEDMLAKKPEEMLREAIKGMLPKNKLAKKMLKKLYIYNTPDHPHRAQKPEPLQSI